MIHFFDDAPNHAAKDAAAPIITAAYTEVRKKYLPELPETVNIYLDNMMLIPETGEGGFAFSPDIITVSFDQDFENKALQKASLRATIFHEGYHLVQGHTNEDPHAQYDSALDSAVYEGCAVVFEREYAGARPPWGNYQAYSEETLSDWAEQLRNISIEDFIKDEGALWRVWAFYDPETKERGRLYLVGTWIVDRVLQRTGKDIRDFRQLQAREILAFIR